MARKKKKGDTPRRKRLKKKQRLQSASSWIKGYSGKNLIKGYAKWFGVDKITAINELRILGVDISEEHELRIRKSIEELTERRKLAKQKRENEGTEVFSPWDSEFDFVAGYTSNGFPYGITIEEMEEVNSVKPVVYIDMDNVLVDFGSGIDKLSEEVKERYEGILDEVPGIFAMMEPMPGAIDAVEKLSEHYELYVLSTAPWKNPSAWSDKLEWIQKYFGKEEGAVFYKRLIISHHKNLNRGDFLIDDRLKNGAGEFKGDLIRFGSERFPDWETVTEYLLLQLDA